MAEPADRQAIVDLLATYCRALDDHDIEGVAATFTDDIETDYGPGRGGPVVGREAVRDRIASGQADFRRTADQMGQSLIDIDGDAATAITYVTAWHEWFDGRVATLRLRYLDDLRRSGAGWLISRRCVEMMGAEGFDGTDWTWVRRHRPA